MIMIITHRLTYWRKCIGCLKLQISFCKRVTNLRALVQNMTCNDKTSYVSTPPCIIMITYRVSMITHMVLLWEWHSMLSASHLCRNPIHHMSSSCDVGLNPTFHTLTPCKQIRHHLSTSSSLRLEALGYRDEGTLTTLRHLVLLSSLPQP